VVAGFRGGQLASVAVGLVVAVGVIRWSTSLAGVGLAVVVVAASIAAATWPVAGRTVEEWAPDALRYAAGVDRARFRATGPLRWLELVSVEVDPVGPVGVIVDHRRSVAVACLAVDRAGFVLAGGDERDRLVAEWAAVLAAAGVASPAGGRLRLQWIERVVPDAATGHLADLASRGQLSEDSPARESYRELLGSVGVGAASHGVVLAVAVQLPRRRGGLHGEDVGVVLLREVAAVRRRLVEANVDSSPPFDPDTLNRYLRLAAAPSGQVALDAAAATGWAEGEVGPPGAILGGDRRWATPGGLGHRWPQGRARRWPWPMAIDEHWSRLRTDGTWQAVYWVAQWPRRDVPADFLAPLLLGGGVRRTFSVVMEAVPPAEAAQQVERARTSELADRELRRRGGFLATVRAQRQAEALAQREAELADGHVAFRFSGYLAVTADDPDSLEVRCEAVEQAAAASDIELRRCYGAQAEAFLATLPTAGGLP
jgi:hypothetical protein